MFGLRVSALGTWYSVLGECQTWCIQAFGFRASVIDGRHMHSYIGIPIPRHICLYDTCLGPPVYVTSPYVGASEVATRRQAAADVLQALVNSGYQTEATEIVGSWITSGLQQYNSNPAQNWKANPCLGPPVYIINISPNSRPTRLPNIPPTSAHLSM
ncbi:hypothetical protein DFH29DRAFT_1020553 [Suillus ampliporus]|nr:hypothetical protein DFH29DRAFT_1020553 [Suillus ampliporus]